MFSRSPWAGFIVAGLMLTATPALAQNIFGSSPANKPPVTTAATPGTPPVAPSPEALATERANKWLVGMAGGSLEGTFLQVASDIARAVDDGENLRVMGMLTQGSAQNVTDLLYTKTVDVGVVNADTLSSVAKQESIKGLEGRIQYVAQLYVNSLQVLVRSDVATLNDLNGQKVAFAAKGSAAADLAAKVLERNGVKAEVAHVGWLEGIEKVKSGEYAAVFATFVKGSPSLFSTVERSAGLHMLPVPMDKFANEYYVPVTLEHADYRGLIAPGEKIQTFGSPVVLAVQNWPKNHERFRKVARFIDRFFANYAKLNTPPYHPALKNVDAFANVPGWKRYWYAEELLKKHSVSRTSSASSPDVPSAGLDEKQERLFREFLEWKKRQAGQ